MTPTDLSTERLLRELAEREERYRSLTETSPDAVITASSDDRILTFNKAAREMFGHGPEIIGQPVTKLIPPHLRHAHRKGVERFLSSGNPTIMGRAVDLSALKSDGSVFQVEMTLSHWDGVDGVAFGAIIRDASERKRVERLKDDVARMIRHDLRSPLVGVTGMGQLLAKGDNLNERQQKAARTIVELGRKMLDMIDRSRDFFQLQEGTYQLKPRPLDLCRVLSNAVDQLEPLALSRQVEVEFFPQESPAGPEQSCPMEGEEGLLENLFANLVKNALEASPPGGKVRVASFPRQGGQGPFWLVEVSNQGVIPPEARARFFEAYVTAGKPGGTGLGTHNAMLAARAHGGRISFTTDSADGTRLLVELPQRQPAGPPLE